MYYNKYTCSSIIFKNALFTDLKYPIVSVTKIIKGLQLWNTVKVFLKHIELILIRTVIAYLLIMCAKLELKIVQIDFETSGVPVEKNGYEIGAF